MKWLIVIVVVLSAEAKAATDFVCLSDCTGKGYNYMLCKERCSTDANTQDLFGTQQQPTEVQRTDFACMNDCTGKNYAYSLCKQKCSY